MDVIEQLQQEFIESFKRKEILWITNVSIKNVHHTYRQNKYREHTTITNLEKLLREHYFQAFPEDTVLLGPARGTDKLPSGNPNEIAIYVTSEGVESPRHQEWLRHNSYGERDQDQ